MPSNRITSSDSAAIVGYEYSVSIEELALLYDKNVLNLSFIQDLFGDTVKNYIQIEEYRCICNSALENGSILNMNLDEYTKLMRHITTNELNNGCGHDIYVAGDRLTMNRILTIVNDSRIVIGFVLGAMIRNFHINFKYINVGALINAWYDNLIDRETFIHIFNPSAFDHIYRRNKFVEQSMRNSDLWMLMSEDRYSAIIMHMTDNRQRSANFNLRRREIETSIYTVENDTIDISAIEESLTLEDPFEIAVTNIQQETTQTYTRTCDQCGEMCDKNADNALVKDICNGCIEIGFARCISCGKVTLKTEKNTKTTNGKWPICDECYKFNRYSTRYFHKLYPHFLGGKKLRKLNGVAMNNAAKYMLGLEFEVPCKDNKELFARRLHKKFNKFLGKTPRVYGWEGYLSNSLFITKVDSTISEDFGIEIVFQPISFSAFYEKNMQDIFKYIRKFTYDARNNEDIFGIYGIHFHASRRYYKFSNIRAMFKIVYCCRRFIMKMSCRKGGEYCDYDSVSEQIYNGNYGCDHHSAISLTDTTIEFRMFQSTSVISKILSYVELVNAILRLSLTINHDTVVEQEDLKRYILGNKKRYVNLYKRITEEC